jgi:hypothetical protein
VGGAFLRSASLAKGGTSKKRLSPHLHQFPTRSNKVSPRTFQTAFYITTVSWRHRAWSWPLTSMWRRGLRMHEAPSPVPHTPSWHGTYISTGTTLLLPDCGHSFGTSLVYRKVLPRKRNLH